MGFPLLLWLLVHKLLGISEALQYQINIILRKLLALLPLHYLVEALYLLVVALKLVQLGQFLKEFFIFLSKLFLFIDHFVDLLLTGD